MSLPSRDDQNTPATSLPPDDERDLTAAEPDQDAAPVRAPSPDTATHPRIKND